MTKLIYNTTNSKLRVVFRLQVVFLIVILFIGASNSAAPALAQNITISINLPYAKAEVLAYSGIIAEFENTHPGIRVHIVHGDNYPYFMQSASEATEFAQSADVLYLESNGFEPEIMLGGYFLDLAPLVNVDNTLNPADFYPAVWQSYQWDNSIWALPVSFELLVLTYDTLAFDAVGLAYPTENWTAAELSTAALTLATYNAQGAVVTKGLTYSYLAEYALPRSLLRDNLFDATVFPAVPRLNTPAAADLLQTWGNLIHQGVVGPSGMGQAAAPMSVSTFDEFNGVPGQGAVLLPGGRAGMHSNSLAISAGTAYPELAYELVKYLSQYPDVFRLTGQFAFPARSIGMPTSFEYLGSSEQALMLQAISNAIPLNELRNFEYFTSAVYEVEQGTLPQDALQNFENIARQNQQSLTANRNTLILSVALPSLAPTSNGGVTLRFGFQAYATALELSNRSLWDAVIADFVASDPQVDQIRMEVIVNPVNYEEYFDCFFTPSGIDTIQPDTLLSLDPLMAADPNFYANDFVTGALQSATFNGRTYGYPLIIQMEVLNYDIDVFQQNGVLLTTMGWTVSDFTNALSILKTYTGDAPVLSTTRYVSTDLLQIIAAYGGLPIDYRTEPPTPNFTDPVNVGAIRSVLDLSRSGYIQYVPRPGNYAMPDLLTPAPIMTGSNSLFTPAQTGTGSTGQVLYPTGDKYTPIGMGVAALYINAATTYPEACYRWISTIAAHPGLIDNGMPARISALNSPELLAAQGNERVAFYTSFNNQLQSPNVIVIPSYTVGSSSLAAWWLENWLYEAFSTYVLDGADLEWALTDAQLKADAYMGCISNLPARAPTQDYNTLYELYTQCASRVDPNISAP